MLGIAMGLEIQQGAKQSLSSRRNDIPVQEDRKKAERRIMCQAMVNAERKTEKGKRDRE